jgi:aryl-alcohol dehydrogenase-like predicted oxidoreductase
MAPALTMYDTSTVGLTYTDTKSVNDLLDVLAKNVLDVLDTAAIYGGSSGRCEELLGSADVAAKKFVLDTKIDVTSRDGGGSLTASAIDASIEAQFKRLRVEKVVVPLEN